MMLDIKNIQCMAGKKTLLKVNSLSIEQGEYFGIVGPNGAGKSTLLKVITGDAPATGDILFQNQNIRDWEARERAKHLAVLPQSSNLPFSLSTREVVEMGLIPLTISKKDADKLIEEKMRLTDCFALRNQAYPSLSGGEKQRVQLARVLVQLSQANKPSLLILDEPTSAQDLGQQHSILNLTKTLCKNDGVTVVAVLHDINHVLATCNRCVIINEGKIANLGKPEQVITPDSVENIWHYRPEELRTAEGQKILV